MNTIEQLEVTTLCKNIISNWNKYSSPEDVEKEVEKRLKEYHYTVIEDVTDTLVDLISIIKNV